MPDGTRQAWSAAGRRGVIGVAILALVAVAGCGRQQAAGVQIKVASAYVMQANGIKPVAAYFVLANNGPADQLVAAHSSAGGKVLMLDPGMTSATSLSDVRTLREITFAGHATTKLDPTGAHLEIVDSGPLQQGTDITLTLVFAHAGPIKVLAQVSNPQTGNSGYFGP